MYNRISWNCSKNNRKRTKPDCRRFFDYGRGSAMECGAVLDVCLKLGLADVKLLHTGKKLLERIVAMLTKLAS